jgi:hypothetical protein
VKWGSALRLQIPWNWFANATRRPVQLLGLNWRPSVAYSMLNHYHPRTDEGEVVIHPLRRIGWKYFQTHLKRNFEMD